MAATTVNIPPPPRLSGNAANDALAQNTWAHQFYEAAIIAGGLVQNTGLSGELQTQFPILYSFGTLEGTEADKMAYFTAENEMALTDITPFARTLLDDANAAAMLTTLGATAFTAEDVQDIVSGMVTAGTGMTIVYNDGANTLTFSASLTGYDTDDLAEGTNKYYTDERVDDRVAALVQNSATGISWTYNDGAGTLTAAFSSRTAKVPFTLVQDLSSVGNTAATETDAFSHTVAANTLSATGESLSFEAVGTFASTASVDKRIKVKFGGTTIFDSGNIAVTTAQSWVVRGRIIRTGSATQKCLVEFSSSFAAFNSSAAYTLGAIDQTAAQTLKLTINGTNANDTVGEAYVETWNPPV